MKSVSVRGVCEKYQGARASEVSVLEAVVVALEVV